MSAGKRNRLVAIQRPLTTASDTGSRSVVWEHFTSVYGYKRDLPRGSEKTHSSTLYPIKQVQWVIRYTRGLTPAMRLVYTENERTEVWEIIAITDSDYNRSEMLLVCELRGQESGEAGGCPTLAEQITEADWNEIKEAMSEEQIEAAESDLCDTPSCEPATYRNSDNSFNQEIASGETYTAPDIEITDVDGSTRNLPANNDVVAEWKNVRLRSTDGIYEAVQLTAYPLGGNSDVLAVTIEGLQGTNAGAPPAFSETFPARPILRFGVVVGNARLFDANTITIGAQIFPVVNSDGVELFTPSDYLGNAVAPDTPLTDDNGAVGSYPVPTSIVIDGEVDSASYAAGALTITPVTGVVPSGIAYPQISPLTSFIDASAAGNDSVALYKAGAYASYKPANPASVACLDPADESGTTLMQNNIFGNKWTYTDLDGNPSSVGTVNPQDRIDWVNHSFGVLPRIVIDHHLGYMVTIDRLQNGSKVDMSNDPTTGDTWYNWLSYISSLSFGGYDDWLPILSISPAPWIRQANNQETLYRNFFVNPERVGDERANWITGESLNESIAIYFREYGNFDLMGSSNVISNKSGNSGFNGSLTKFLAMRMLTAADIIALTT